MDNISRRSTRQLANISGVCGVLSIILLDILPILIWSGLGEDLFRKSHFPSTLSTTYLLASGGAACVILGTASAVVVFTRNSNRNYDKRIRNAAEVGLVLIILSVAFFSFLLFNEYGPFAPRVGVNLSVISVPDGR